MRFCLSVAWCCLAGLAAVQAASLDSPRKVVSVVRADPRSGRLVRTLAVSRKPASILELRDSGIDVFIEDAAKRHQIDPALVHSVIQVESNYDPFAISSKGAQGIMQLMPGTARRFAVNNAFSPAENIEGGVRYLKYLLTLYKGNRELAIAAYNAGEGSITRYGGIPPYRETVQYVRKVSKKWESEPVANAPQDSAVQAQMPAHPPIEQYVDASGVVHFETRMAR